MRKVRSLISLSVLIVFVVGLLFSFPFHAYAGDPLLKLGRGAANLGTGWLEIPREIGKEQERAGEIAGFFVGPLKGLAKGLGRTAVGLFEILTFLIPIPRNYEPVIQPEFVFGGG